MYAFFMTGSNFDVLDQLKSGRESEGEVKD